MKVGESVIDAKTDIVSILSSAEYAISIKQYDKANELLLASIMFAPVSAQSSKLDGTPFIRDWYKVGEIRRYLMSLGAVDIYRRGFN